MTRVTLGRAPWEDCSDEARQSTENKLLNNERKVGIDFFYFKIVSMNLVLVVNLVRVLFSLGGSLTQSLES